MVVDIIAKDIDLISIKELLERTDSPESIIRDFNQFAKSLHETGSYRQFRKNILTGDSELKSICDPNELSLISDKVKQIEEDLVLKYQALVNKLAYRWASCEDAVSEANIGLLHAIRGYSNSSVKFMTYAYKTITNHLMVFGDPNYKLKSAYTKCKVELENDGGRFYTFEEVCDFMELNDKEKNLLAASMHKNVSLDKVADSFDKSQKNPLDSSILSELKSNFSEIVKSIHLDDWEKIVLNAYLSASNKAGWQTEIARSTINPKTNKPYSRRAPHVAMQRIKEKIKEAA